MERRNANNKPFLFISITFLILIYYFRCKTNHFSNANVTFFVFLHLNPNLLIHFHYEKNMIIALAGLMLFAFTQCGGGETGEAKANGQNGE